MKAFVLIYEVYYPYEGGNTDIWGVYSSNELATSVAEKAIEKDWPKAVKTGSGEWDLSPDTYNDHTLIIQTIEMDGEIPQ